VDLKSAFDTISPQLIYKVMELEKFPTIYMEAMHQLTGSGTGRVFANSLLRPAFSIWPWNRTGILPVKVISTWVLTHC
jgi:hypothetical protein